MSEDSAGLISRAYAVLAKDIRQELRSRYGLNTILLFGITTLAVISYSVGQSGLQPKLHSAIFWTIMFFSSIAGLAQVFVREEESGTSLALRLSAEPNSVYVGKLVFNLILLSILALIITPGFFIFMDAPANNLIVFGLILALGVAALCAATTLVAAIIARAAMKGTLFAVMALPVVIIPMMVLVDASGRALDGATIGQVFYSLQALVAYTVVMVTASYLLFRFVWLE